MEIRTFVTADTEALVALWRGCGLVHPKNDPYRDIDRKVADSPWGLLVATHNGTDDADTGRRIVGSVMVGYDGHRGWINYLACAPDHRRRGVARSLMEHARDLLAERGCLKINLQVRAGNDAANSFYESLGYSDDGVTSFGLRLVHDD
ncbi:MAG: GNAT family acetyltransferase [Actinomycetes bacterium]